MIKRGKILRIRLFNMANYSAGSGFLPHIALLGAIVSIPITLSLLSKIVYLIEDEGGKLNYQTIKSKMKRSALLKYLAVFVVLAALNASLIIGSIFDYGLAILWSAAIPTLGVYLSVLYSAKFTADSRNLTKGNWQLFAVAFVVLFAIMFFPILIISESFFYFY